MKKVIAIITLIASVLFLASCVNNEGTEFKVDGFAYAYQTSEVQEFTHDVYLAHCMGDIYVEVPETYYLPSIRLKETQKIIYYRIYGVDHKVSNKGWEFVNNKY